jgi:hypothetical protein
MTTYTLFLLFCPRAHPLLLTHSAVVLRKRVHIEEEYTSQNSPLATDPGYAERALAGWPVCEVLTWGPAFLWW